MSSSDNQTSKPRQKIHPRNFDRPDLWTGDFVKFAAEIGYLSWSWNAIHADLCDIFCIIVGDSNVARAIWNEIRSDSGQRAILKAAGTVKFKANSQLKKELLWLLKEMEKLSRIRNAAFHTLWKIDQSFSLDELLSFDRPAVPDLKRGNPKGARLSNADAKLLFNSLSGHLMTLSHFARSLSLHALGFDDGEPLPQRPQRPRILDDHLK